MKSWGRNLVLVILSAVLFSACAPNLKYYEPPKVKPSSAEIATALAKSPDWFPAGNEEYGRAFAAARDNSVIAVRALETKLTSWFVELYEHRGEAKAAKKISNQIRQSNREVFLAFNGMKMAFETLKLKSSLIENPEARKKAEAFANTGFDAANEMLTLLDETRQMMDMIDHYVRAKSEWNLSALTKENENRYNRIAASVDSRGKEIIRKSFELVAMASAAEKGGAQ